MALPPGWKRDKSSGRAERYISPTGEIVSRRQMENARARESGFKSWSHYQRIAGARGHGARRYQYFAEQYADETGQSLRNIRGPRSRFTEAYFSVNWRDTNPNGSLARFLVMVGKRMPNASYAVGDTPRAHLRGNFKLSGNILSRGADLIGE